MSDPRLPVPPIDLVGTFLAAQRLRQGRQEEELNQLRLAELYRQQQAGPDPMAAREREVDLASKEADLAGKAQSQVDARARATDEFRQRVSRILEADPLQAPNMRRQVDARVRAKLIDDFEVPGFDSRGPLEGPPAPMSAEQVGVLAGAEPEKAPEAPTSYREHLLEEKDPAYKAKQAEARRNKGVSVNVGQGKPLTAEATAEMADWTTVTGTLNDLFDSFTQRVPNADVIGQLQARGEKFVPNSDVQSYLDEAGTAAQMVGVILENGKLAEADFPRYLARMPQPGDSPERAKNKIENIARQVERKLNARKKAFGEQGYRVPGGATLPEKGSRQREAMNAKIRELRAAGKSDDEIRQMLGGGQ